MHLITEENIRGPDGPITEGDEVETINAIQIKKPKQIEYVKISKPVPLEGEALLKIKYCGFCGSDIASYAGEQPFTTYPRIPGHEFSAEIVEINSSNKNNWLRPGMIVTGIPYFNCGVCYPCINGKKIAAKKMKLWVSTGTVLLPNILPCL